MRKRLLLISMFIVVLIMLAGCNKASNYNRDGKKSFENGKYQEAAASFQKAITANPNKAEYYIDYGMALIALGNYEEALAQFDLVYADKDMLTIKENNKRALRGKGIAYFYMAEYQEAVGEFEKALKISELSELNVDILYYMGNSLRITGAYDAAIEAYTSVISSDRKNAAAYGERAFCYQNMGEYEKSLTDYDKAISLKSNNFNFYFGKYYLMLENGNQTEAAKVLEKAAKLSAKTGEDKFNLAKVYFLQEDYETAEAKLKESYSAGISEAYYYIGEIYRNKKDYANAIFYYETYINSMEVSSAKVYNQIAACLMKQEDYKKALEYLETGIAFRQSDSLKALRKNQIIALENLGMFDKAKEKLEEYVADYPTDSKAIREAEFVISIMETVAQIDE